MVSMDRKKKIASAILVSLALFAFTAPFLFRHEPPAPSPKGGGSGGGNGGNNGGTTPPPAQPPSGDTNPPIPPSWHGWNGFCHGQGLHLGILKKASVLNMTLPACA